MSNTQQCNPRESAHMRLGDYWKVPEMPVQPTFDARWCKKEDDKRHRHRLAETDSKSSLLKAMKEERAIKPKYEYRDKRRQHDAPMIDKESLMFEKQLEARIQMIDSRIEALLQRQLKSMNMRQEDTECALFDENTTEVKNPLSATSNLNAEKLKSIAAMRTAAIIELDKLQSDFGKFSYYLWDNKLIAHLEDEKARENRDRIHAAVDGIAHRYLQGQESTSVEVSVVSLNAMLCSPGIGSKITVNDLSQTAGMYILHRGAVHWVSVAHNYLRNPILPLHQAAINTNPRQTSSVEFDLPYVHLDFGDDLLLATDSTLVPSSMPYVCLVHKPQDRMGRNLLHSVDIMIGQVPMVARRHEAGALDNLMNLCEARRGEVLSYRIRRLWRPTPLVGNEHGDYTRYDITLEKDYERKYKNVTALLRGNTLAEGTIVPSFGMIYLDGEGYHNVMFISPSNGVSPQRGDSGSIWVAKDTSEAVAITVGKMTVAGASCREVWVAVLLYPCLEVLCLQHKPALPDLNQIMLFDGHSLLDG